MLRQIIGQAKKHPSLIPLFVFIGAGGTGALLYVMRLAFFNPDVCWDRKNNPEPWNKLAPNEQYKALAGSVVEHRPSVWKSEVLILVKIQEKQPSTLPPFPLIFSLFYLQPWPDWFKYIGPRC